MKEFLIFVGELVRASAVWRCSARSGTAPEAGAMAGVHEMSLPFKKRKALGVSPELALVKPVGGAHSESVHVDVRACVCLHRSARVTEHHDIKCPEVVQSAALQMYCFSDGDVRLNRCPSAHSGANVQHLAWFVLFVLVANLQVLSGAMFQQSSFVLGTISGLYRHGQDGCITLMVHACRHIFIANCSRNE